MLLWISFPLSAVIHYIVQAVLSLILPRRFRVYCLAVGYYLSIHIQKLNV